MQMLSRFFLFFLFELFSDDIAIISDHDKKRWNLNFAYNQSNQNWLIYFNMA